MTDAAQACIEVTHYDEDGRIAGLNDNELVGIDSPWGFDLKEGRHWIGDPCYLFGGDHPEGMDHEAWIKAFCQRNVWNHTYGFGVFEFGGHRIPWSSTAYGDGEYPVFRGDEIIGKFGVDAGLFCVVSEAFIKQWAPRWLDGHYPIEGVWVDLGSRNYVEFRYDGYKGKMEIGGRLLIDTDPGEECPNCGHYNRWCDQECEHCGYGGVEDNYEEDEEEDDD